MEKNVHYWISPILRRNRKGESVNWFQVGEYTWGHRISRIPSPRYIGCKKWAQEEGDGKGTHGGTISTLLDQEFTKFRPETDLAFIMKKEEEKKSEIEQKALKRGTMFYG